MAKEGKVPPDGDPVIARRKAEQEIEIEMYTKQRNQVQFALDDAQKLGDTQLVDAMEWVRILSGCGVHPTTAIQTWQRVKHPFKLEDQK